MDITNWRGFLTSKLTREQKIEIYKERKQGKTVIALTKKYNIRKDNINYLIRLIDYHGFDVLRKNKNRYYSPALKQEIIDKVLVYNQSIKSTAVEYGLSSFGMISNWIKTYKENGCVIVEKTRGRPSTMKKKSQKLYEDMTPEEKIKYLEARNLYLEAENEYRKKLEAVVQARKNRQPKKK